MAVKVTQDNSGAITAALRIIADRLPQELARQTAEEAKSLCPVSTGQLRDSIHTEDNVVVADAPHAAVVEFGNHSSAGRPFMTPAIESVSQRAADTARKMR